MKLDDESDLAAYLDNELEPDRRRQVEDAIVADPELASRLADMMALRASVSGLPRPEAPCRLASVVLARIEAAESARSRRPYYWVATAASLVFGFALALRSGLIARTDADLVAHHPAVPSGPARPFVEDHGSGALVEGSLDAPQTSPIIAGPVIDPDAAARRRMVGILDRAGLGRILVVPDIDDADAARRVDDLLRETARKNPEYGRLTVSPGLGIDPQHPRGGEVFVAEMDDLERREFLTNLGKAFVTVVDEPTSDPRLGTLLAELDGISLGAGRRAAGLKPPPADTRVALQHHEEKPHQRKADVRRILPGVSPFPFPGDPLEHSPVVEQSPERGENPADVTEAHPGQVPRKPGSKAAGPVPVLIWVASSRPEE